MLYLCLQWACALDWLVQGPLLITGILQHSQVWKTTLSLPIITDLNLKAGYVTGSGFSCFLRHSGSLGCALLVSQKAPVKSVDVYSDTGWCL